MRVDAEESSLNDGLLYSSPSVGKISLSSSSAFTLSKKKIHLADFTT